ncbi:MAG: isocitrate lyase/phosphoenolpyruvate mutase family protein [Actinobacteria bacterium]|nr:isocitrate lyase/phosphoenolpyruvate mutase family protein [Actinomycetota bacterium]
MRRPPGVVATSYRGLEAHSHRLRSLHVRGDPLLLPNAWDVASAKAVAGGGFPVVATTSGGIAATLGYEDHEGAPADEMLSAAARIARSVDVPVTVDAEAGYGMAPTDLVEALLGTGAAFSPPLRLIKRVRDGRGILLLKNTVDASVVAFGGSATAVQRPLLALEPLTQ